MPRKTEIYTWRVSSAMKASLEEVARDTNRSIARLLDEIVAERLNASRHVGLHAPLGGRKRLRILPSR
jgi:hypothetical protein